MDTDRARELLGDLDENSQKVNNLVNGIIGEYIEDMDDYLDTIRDKIKDGELTDRELEEICVELPIYIYYASERLEHLGVESDVAESMKDESYNESLLEAEGTIPEKEGFAQNQTLEEEIIEKAYKRAYRKLKTKIKKAENVYKGVKKVIDKRNQEMSLNMMTSKYEG